MSRRLAHDYFDGTVECLPESFRFYQLGSWYTALFRETRTYNRFRVRLLNERFGTFSEHFHTVPSPRQAIVHDRDRQHYWVHSS